MCTKEPCSKKILFSKTFREIKRECYPKRRVSQRHTDALDMWSNASSTFFKDLHAGEVMHLIYVKGDLTEVTL